MNLRLNYNIIFVIASVIIIILFGLLIYEIEYVQSKKIELNDTEQSYLFLTQKFLYPPATRLTNQPILSRSTAGGWDSGESTEGNCVIKTQDGKYKMLYYGNGDIVHKVGLAESTDGINWTKYAGNPVLTPGPTGSWDDGGVAVFPGCLIRQHDGKYYLYYTGLSKKPTGNMYLTGKVGLATSKDLINWTKDKNNPIVMNGTNYSWDAQAVIEASVIFDGNYFGSPASYQMWYTGVTNTAMAMALGYAESTDGIHWTKYEGNPIFEPTKRNKIDFDGKHIEVHHVSKIGDWYILLYEALEIDWPSWYRIGLAYSKDGKIWARSSINPVLNDGPFDSWDKIVVHPSLLQDTNRILLYYVGLNSVVDMSNHSVGVASLNPLILNPIFQPTLSFPLWINQSIDIKGLSTAEIPSKGFKRKTFEVVSDKPGTMFIEIDSAGTNNWHIFESIPTNVVTYPEGFAKNYAKALTEYGFVYSRMRFIPSSNATVSAWLTLDK